MVAIPGIPPIFMWVGFIVLVIIFLIIDLGVFNRKSHALSIKEALAWTAVWVSLALCFNGFIWWEFGKDAGLKFFTGYIIEKSLSVDNLFVMILIFTSFKIDPKYQHKVLFWGILGAIIMRGIMIIIGASLVNAFHWILYVFGAFLIYSGVQIFFEKEEEFDPHDHFVVRMIKKFTRVSRDIRDGKFTVKENGKRAVTIFFVVLLMIEIMDVMFAFDSIPAIFGITTDPFIVFTSNIFAILGLRSLYFVMAKMHKYFVYLPMGLAVILIFIGLKMMVEPFIEIPIMLSLGIIAGILTIYILASLFLLPKGYRERNQKNGNE